MPRPNNAWEKKYGKHSQAEAKKTLLSASDDVLSACMKIGAGVPEAQAIMLQAIRKLSSIDAVMILLDADDMGMHGEKIVKAFHEWSKRDYEKMVKGLFDRDPSLVALLKAI